MTIPSAASIRSRLAALTNRQLVALAALSGTPVGTLRKLANGERLNPGIDTVRQFLPHIRSAMAAVKGVKGPQT